MTTRSTSGSKYIGSYSGAVRDAKSGRYIVARNKASAYSASTASARRASPQSSLRVMKDPRPPKSKQ